MNGKLSMAPRNWAPEEEGALVRAPPRERLTALRGHLRNFLGTMLICCSFGVHFAPGSEFHLADRRRGQLLDSGCKCNDLHGPGL